MLLLLWLQVLSETQFERVGGTSMGGGTFWGLGSLLTKAKVLFLRDKEAIPNLIHSRFLCRHITVLLWGRTLRDNTKNGCVLGNRYLKI